MKRSILMLEHDDDDRYMTRAIFEENDYPVALQFVDNSNDLFAHLLSCEKQLAPLPAVILLTHNAMPSNAVEILDTLKSDRRFCHIPVVVLSGTMNEETLKRCYEAGANSFIRKPVSSRETSRKISDFFRYWFQTVELP